MVHSDTRNAFEDVPRKKSLAERAWMFADRVPPKPSHVKAVY